MPLVLLFVGFYFAITLWEAEEAVKEGEAFSLLKAIALKRARRRPAFIFGLAGAALLAALNVWMVLDGSQPARPYALQWVLAVTLIVSFSALSVLKHSDWLGQKGHKKRLRFDKLMTAIFLAIVLTNFFLNHDN